MYEKYKFKYDLFPFESPLSHGGSRSGRGDFLCGRENPSKYVFLLNVLIPSRLFITTFY